MLLHFVHVLWGATLRWTETPDLTNMFVNMYMLVSSLTNTLSAPSPNVGFPFQRSCKSSPASQAEDQHNRKNHPILDDEKKTASLLQRKNMVRTYCWWFRNPIPNHRLGWCYNLVNNGINYRSLNWWVSRISSIDSICLEIPRTCAWLRWCACRRGFLSKMFGKAMDRAIVIIDYLSIRFVHLWCIYIHIDAMYDICNMNKICRI